MIAAGDLKRGITLRLDGNLYRVTKTEYSKPGRGTASMKTTLVDIASGSSSTRIFGADDRLEDVFVESEASDYLYSDGDTLHFMNVQTYDQYEVPKSLFDDDVLYIKDGMQIELKVLDGRVIDYVLPTTETYTVLESEVAVVGDTAGNVTKKIKTETGLSVTVPIFINEGDSIKVDTRDGSYVGRG